MQKPGIHELPEEMVNTDDPSDEEYGQYVVLREQVAGEPDAEVLKEAAYEAPAQMARFAFCYLTKYSYPSLLNDAYSGVVNQRVGKNHYRMNCRAGDSLNYRVGHRKKQRKIDLRGNVIKKMYDGPEVDFLIDHDLLK